MDGRSISVLLVEDNPLDFRLIQEMFAAVKNSALILDWAGDLETGLKVVAAGDSDVVLLDLSLPESRGLDTFARVQAVAPQVPVVVLTGLDDEAVAVEAVRAGAQDYLVKGQVDSNLLVRAIHYAVQRKQAENALRESESLYRTLVETSPDGILLMDLEANILMANQGLARLCGATTAQELVGQSVLDFFAPEDLPRARRDLQTFVETGGVGRAEYWLLRRDGSPYLAEVSAAAISGARGEPGAILYIMRDISERRQAEKEREQLLAAEREQRIKAETLMEELRRTQSQLIQSAKMAAVGQLAAGVAHELNNPLQSVMGFAELLQRSAAARDEQLCQDLEIIVTESRRARDIVLRLLEFSRQAKSSRQRADLEEVVQETLALLHQHLINHGIVLQESCAGTLPWLFFDAGQMRQVFLNLFGNAIQAMPQGGTLSVSTRQQGEMVVVRISDTGVGIPEADLPYIFDPFFTTRPVGQATGLGLSVSMGIVQEHGGRITVDSSAEKGSVFEVWLPVEAPGP